MLDSSIAVMGIIVFFAGILWEAKYDNFQHRSNFVFYGSAAVTACGLATFFSALIAGIK
jgi:hypothetical protein